MRIASCAIWLVCGWSAPRPGALQRLTALLADELVLVIAAVPAVRAVLEHADLAGIRLHDPLADALAALPSSPGTWHPRWADAPQQAPAGARMCGASYSACGSRPAPVA